MTAAAAYLSVKTGRTVWPSEVRRKIGINIGRWTVSETKPEPPLALCEAEKIMPGVGEYRKPLLRYTWGERPWERGIGRVWR
jgi:bifunctional DNA-binding transcriptional regulator/antitoxin component of YhaV-PrlF toxin-antitoxin module